jgi:hypothetical protein
MAFTIASRGAQYIAVILFNRALGNLNWNIIFALAANILVTAAATTGIPAVKDILVSLSLLLGAMIFGGAISGIRGCLYPKGEIGIFFGTFNPFHVTHVVSSNGRWNCADYTKYLFIQPSCHGFTRPHCGGVKLAYRSLIADCTSSSAHQRLI